MTDTEKILKQYISSQPAISLAYLFGSQVSGTAYSGSDVDVAFLFKKGHLPTTDGLLQMQDDLISQLRREVDIVILNEASPIIRMQVLRKGKKIIERDHQVYIDFFVRTVREYDDLKMVRSVIEKKILKGNIYG